MRRRSDRHSPDDEVSQERWLVSYADFITLMFAFFAVLYATSEKDLNKTREFQESIKRFLIKAGAFGETGQQINQGDKHTTPIEPPIQTFQRSRPEAEQVLTQTEQMVEGSFTSDERGKYIQDVAADEWGVRITLNGEALFPAGSEKFREDALPIVTRLSEVFARFSGKLMIEGHVMKGERGPYRSTWEFASARAVNMLRFLQAKQNLRSDRLGAASYADSRPLFDDPKNAALNSRLEIVLLNPDLD